MSENKRLEKIKRKKKTFTRAPESAI